MDQDTYRILWQEKSLYDESFISKFGINGPHWTFESQQKRELSLRHDYVCALLCNLEQTRPKRTIDEVDRAVVSAGEPSMEPEPKKPLVEPEIANEEDEVMLEVDANEYEELVSSDSDNDYADLDYVHVQDIKDSEIDEKYRYMLLEGTLHAAAIQNYYCEKFNIEKFTKIFDIVDRQREKFIEVKVTLNPQRCVREFEEDINTNDHTGLICIHPETIEVVMSNISEPMPGEDKAVVFLIKRLGIMRTLGLADSPVTEEIRLAEAVFSSEYINSELEKFQMICTEGLEENRMTDFNCSQEAELERIDPKELFELMKDPTEGDCKTVVWKGMISPPTDVEFLETSGQDLESIKSFLNELLEAGISKISGPENNFLAVKEALHHYAMSPHELDNFRFIVPKRNDEEDFPRVKEALGIGRKGMKYNEAGQNMKQEEPEPISERKYHPWFDAVLQGLSERHKFVDSTTNNLESECRAFLKLGRDLQDVLQKMLDEVGKHYVGLMMSQYRNLGSRISGTYLVGASRKTSHQCIACMPLVANLRKLSSKQDFRVSSGIVLRAPHHARNANDSINLLVIERTKSGEITPKEYYEHETILEGKKYNYRVRQTAIKKGAAIHLTFINNALFNTANLVGEMILNNKNTKDMRSLITFYNVIVDNVGSMKYLLARVVESVLMAAIGNSRDEGYLAMSRKLFMIMLAWRRGRDAFTWNVKEFAEKINECLIDNPFSMHFHITFKYMAAIYSQIKGEEE